MPTIHVSEKAIAGFCGKWKIAEHALIWGVATRRISELINQLLPLLPRHSL
jgi:hypothetical protein